VAAYLMVGIDLEGRKECLGIWLGQSESAKCWLGVLNEFKNRGVNDVLIFAVDGLTGFPEAIRAVYPLAEIQRCLVHQVRNSLAQMAWKDRKEVASSLRSICTAPTEEAGLMALAEFEDAWGRKYPQVVLSWKRHWPELATFFNYPEAVRRLIYTTNPIESLNSRVRKTVKGKSVFPTEAALFKALYLAVAEAEKRWTMRTRNWSETMAQLSIFFQERLKDYLC
jgi:putative transposase